jgi:hypothetical protein
MKQWDKVVFDTLHEDGTLTNNVAGIIWDVNMKTSQILTKNRFVNCCQVREGSPIAEGGNLHGLDLVGWWLHSFIPNSSIKITEQISSKEQKPLNCCRCNYSDCYTTMSNMKDGGFICYTCLDGRRNAMKDLLING